MADRTRRGPVKNLLKWAKQFSDPKFNPERRGALQMIAAAPASPLLSKIKLATGPTLDAPAFYEALIRKLGDFELEGNFVNRADIAAQLHRDLWDNARGIRKGADYAIQSAYDNLLEGDNLTNALIEDKGPFMGGDKGAWDKAVRAFHDAEDGTNDALNEASQEALSEYVDTLDPDTVVSEFGYDDAYGDYFDEKQVNTIQRQLDDEVERLYGPRVTGEGGNWQTWDAARDDVAKRLGLPEFLEKSQKIGNAASGDLDLYDVPDFEYVDPEALQYAQLRNMLEHPALSPNDLLRITGTDPSKLVAGATPERIAEALYYKVRPQHMYGGNYPVDKPPVVKVNPSEQALDFGRLPETTKRAFGEYVDQQIVKPAYGWESPEWNRALRDMRKRIADRDPEFMRAEDLPSYITNRTSPFRVTYDSALRGRKRAIEPLDYETVAKALPPEEYSTGGPVWTSR